MKNKFLITIGPSFLPPSPITPVKWQSCGWAALFQNDDDDHDDKWRWWLMMIMTMIINDNDDGVPVDGSCEFWLTAEYWVILVSETNMVSISITKIMALMALTRWWWRWQWWLWQWWGCRWGEWGKARRGSLSIILDSALDPTSLISPLTTTCTVHTFAN